MSDTAPSTGPMPSVFPSFASTSAAASERILFVHAHPDDESITTGGSLALLTERGAAVTVLTCTRGESGEVIPSELQYLLDDEEALAAHRETELAEAMRILGVTDHRWLGAEGACMVGREPRRYRDSGMVWGDAGPEPLTDLPENALCAASLGDVAADIATVIATTRATAVVSYNEFGGYGHPDHIFAHRAARRAAEAMGVPFYVLELDDTAASASPGVKVTVDVSTVLDRKVEALRAYRSQLTVEGDHMIMPGGQVEPITSIELFRRIDVSAPHPVAWSDYGLASRISGCLFAVVAGATVGALATVNHQAQATLLGSSLPVGLILGLIVVVGLLGGLRLLFETRLVPGLTALGILGAIGILSVESAGGSVLIPDSPLAYYWIYGPAAIAAIVLAWPRFPQSDER